MTQDDDHRDREFIITNIADREDKSDHSDATPKVNVLCIYIKPGKLGSTGKSRRPPFSEASIGWVIDMGGQFMAQRKRTA